MAFLTRSKTNGNKPEMVNVLTNSTTVVSQDAISGVEIDFTDPESN